MIPPPSDCTTAKQKIDGMKPNISKHPAPSKRYLGRGGVKYALLKLLEGEQMHRYQMMKALNKQSGGIYVPSPGSIYPTLQMLELSGFITVKLENTGKKIYRITDEGRASLQHLSDKTRPAAVKNSHNSEAEEAARLERIHINLGLSSDSFDLLLLVTHAEQEAAASKDRAHLLQRIISDQQQQIHKFLNGCVQEITLVHD